MITDRVTELWHRRIIGTSGPSLRDLPRQLSIRGVRTTVIYQTRRSVAVQRDGASRLNKKYPL